MRDRTMSYTVALIGLLAGFCAAASHDAAATTAPPVALAATAASATATIHNAGNVKSEISGTVTFTEDGDKVKVVADIDGLTPGDHGFHIHAKPDLSAPT